MPADGDRPARPPLRGTEEASACDHAPAPSLALEFGVEEMRLHVLEPEGGIRAIGVVPLAGAGFTQRMETLRAAGETETGASVALLWLPDEHVLAFELDAPDAAAAAALADARLAERFGAEADAMARRVVVTPGGGWRAVAADRQTIDEAAAYARRWGFEVAAVTPRGVFPEAAEAQRLDAPATAPAAAPPTGVSGSSTVASSGAAAAPAAVEPRGAASASPSRRRAAAGRARSAEAGPARPAASPAPAEPVRAAGRPPAPPVVARAPASPVAAAAPAPSAVASAPGRAAPAGAAALVRGAIASAATALRRRRAVLLAALTAALAFLFLALALWPRDARDPPTAGLAPTTALAPSAAPAPTAGPAATAEFAPPPAAPPRAASPPLEARRLAELDGALQTASLSDAAAEAAPTFVAPLPLAARGEGTVRATAFAAAPPPPPLPERTVARRAAETPEAPRASSAAPAVAGSDAGEARAAVLVAALGAVDARWAASPPVIAAGTPPAPRPAAAPAPAPAEDAPPRPSSAADDAPPAPPSPAEAVATSSPSAEASGATPAEAAVRPPAEVSDATPVEAAVPAPADAAGSSSGPAAVEVAASPATAPSVTEVDPSSEPAPAPNAPAGVASPPPRPRPALAPATLPTRQAALRAPRPPARPDLTAVARARAVESETRAATEAATAAARQATLRDALLFEETALLGVFDGLRRPHALLRMPSGEFRQVWEGDRVENWTVIEIGSDFLQLRRGAERRRLMVPGRR